jgi:hypothetical protein
LSIRPTPNSELAVRFPGLLGLARDYINLSWDFEFDEPADGVVAFLSTRPELASSCAAGIDAVLHECQDEAARQKQLAELGWGYAPGPGKLDAFLVWTRDTLQHAASSETAAG